MLAWMLYVAVVTVFLGGAAWAGERSAHLLRTPARWIWLLAMLASLIVPAAIASVAIQVPTIFSKDAVEKIIPLRSIISAHTAPLKWIAPRTRSLSEKLSYVDPAVRRGWMFMSIALVVTLVASGIHLFRRKRQWNTGMLAGTSVLIAPNVGPAVVGLIKPCVVVPAWLWDLPTSHQAAALAHEKAHLDAGDQRLLTVAFCLLVFMPWNIPLWWQVRRLRYAIEVDCDARVLRSGYDVTTYGAALIDVAERQSSFVAPVAAMSESKSLLEERIRLMTSSSFKWQRLAAVAMGCVSVTLVAVASEVSPPNSDSYIDEGRPQVQVLTSVLDGYLGYYRFGEYVVMSVTRDGQKVLTQMTGQRVVENYPVSSTEIYSKDVKGLIAFISDSNGRSTEMVLRQHGRVITAPRIDASTAERIANALAIRIRDQTPMRGSEAAVRRMVESIAAGKPNYEEMSPVLAEAVRNQLPRHQETLARLGPVISIEFRGVGNQGWDIYDLRHEHGSSQLRIALNSEGIITGALSSVGP
jgi:beta-lactamase regulating signal transducer with metallopeptidase domain